MDPSGSRQQPASANNGGTSAVELATAQLLRAVRSGKRIGESMLQPQTTAWHKDAQRLVDGLQNAHDLLESLPEPAVANARDAQVLEAALAQLTDAERAGAEAVILQEALNGVRGCKYLRPQAVQLISTPNAAWGIKQSASIAADVVLAQHLPVLSHAFQLAVGTLLLHQSMQRLPRPDGVPRLQQICTSAPALHPSKPLPPSKAARADLAVVWQALVVFLARQGTLSLPPVAATGHRRWPPPPLLLVWRCGAKQYASQLRASCSTCPCLLALPHPLLVQGWTASCATIHRQRCAMCRKVPISAAQHCASLLMARRR